MQLSNHNLNRFIEQEKSFFEQLDTGISWQGATWKTGNWLFHRGQENDLSFSVQTRFTAAPPKGMKLPAKGPLPLPFSDFAKALAVYLKRTKGVGYMAIRGYVNECRRLYGVMFGRGENSPVQLTRWHFEQVLRFLKAIRYKNLYDAGANLQVIAEVMDKKQITPLPLQFVHGEKGGHQYFAYTRVADLESDVQRHYEEKLPSLEAMKAYATCTNNPLDEREEILLRTIDLLLAMGQRANEVTLIPYDCWVERPKKDASGEVITDAGNQPILETGIRYYAEKHFQSRVHWLADQDVPFAKRAVDRLKVLTAGAREVARWQEANPGRIWRFLPEEVVEDHALLPYLGFANTYNLYLFLNDRHGIKPVKIREDISRETTRGKTFCARYYRASDIEKLLLPKLDGHIALREGSPGNWKVILRTSEVLSIRFEGSFRFKRYANVFRVLPSRTLIKEINGALGSVKGIESIFERRGLTEADGSKIELTSHQPRHWRNTLYELAGMSNVQQALALGRQKLDQNEVYQHRTLKEKTALHQEYLMFSSAAEKVTFLHSGVREKKIVGPITDTYHFLREHRGLTSAESFLNTHALALHITPFGGCTHDFSQAPCPKHLQCWNGCSHLHRTNTPGETERLQKQLEAGRQALEKMKAEGAGELGSDVWIQDLERKVMNLEAALLIHVGDIAVPVFPDGKPVTVALDKRKNSSV